MLGKEEIQKNLKNCIDETRLPLPKRKGKVRDVYDLGDKLLFIASDRLSAFDRNLALIPFKGEILNRTSAFWFKETEDIAANHFLAMPDPNASLVKKLNIFPIEFVVRGYLSGSTSTSAWMAYQKGEREFCGNTLPEGMKKNEAFKEPILTPTTKDDEHDEKISPKEIIGRGLMSQEMWDKASLLAIKLYKRGVEITQKRNLILVDTKYEFGYDENGTVYLCDEVHTPDSSRFWIRDTYEESLRKGEEPKNIDKEFLRLWFRDHCDPYKDETLPKAPDDLVVELSLRYQQLFETLTGETFESNGENVLSRLERNLASYLKN